MGWMVEARGKRNEREEKCWGWALMESRNVFNILLTRLNLT